MAGYFPVNYQSLLKSCEWIAISDEIVTASGSFVVGVDLTAKDFEPPAQILKK